MRITDPDPMPDNAGTAATERERAVLILAGILFGLVEFWAHDPFDLSHSFMVDVPFGRDFANFWLGTRLVLDGDPAALIDLPRYNALIMTTFHRDAVDRFVFSYPPTVFAPLVPFAQLPYRFAVSLWTVLNLGALALSVRLVAAAFRPERQRDLAMIAVASPAAAAMMIFGHFGGLLAVGATVALKESERRPWLAGFCLAALSLKPQVALILGVILLLAGRWRCILVSVLGAAILMAVSAAAFGLEPWRNFFAWTVPYQSDLLVEFDPKMLRTLTSVFFTSRFFVSADTAWILQGIVSFAAIAGAALLMRRRGSEAPADLFLILLAVLVALPYANAYDLAIAVPALTVWLFGERAGRPPILMVILWVLPPVIWILSCNGLTYASLPIAAALFAGLRDRLPKRAPRRVTARLRPSEAAAS